MKTKVKKINQTVSELSVTIEAKIVSKDYNEIVKKYRKMTVVKGFRKGKAPIALVERYYGDYIKEEFNEVAGEKYYKEALDESDVNPVSPGQLSKFDWDKGKDLELSYTFETNPEFDLVEYEGIEIPHETSMIKEDAVDDKMKELLESTALLKDVEGKSVEGDEVAGTLEIMDENQERTIQEKDERFAIGENEYSDEFNKKLIGILAGDEVIAPLFKPSDKEDKKFVGKMIIDTIKRKELPEMDDDFAKDLDYENLEDMKTQVGKDLQVEIDKDNKTKVKEDILKHLVKINEFEVPQTFVTNYTNEMMKPYAGQLDDDARKQLYPMFEESAISEVKKYFILNKLKEDINPEIDEDFRNDFIQSLAKNMNMDVAKYKKMYQERIENKDFDEAVKEAKVIDIIAEKAIFIPYPKEKEEDIEDAEIVSETEEETNKEVK
ncbi:MAG: trigger factor [Candidatus Cloacimonadota bacterium]|nr:trigger factor [Candidatus Cloacimonadota bacterium]